MLLVSDILAGLGEPVTESLPSEIPIMQQYHIGGQDLLCSATEGRGTDRRAVLAARDGSTARTGGIPTGSRLVGIGDRQEQLLGAQGIQREII